MPTDSQLQTLTERWMPEFCALMGVSWMALGHLLIQETVLVDAGWIALAIGIVAVAVSGLARKEVGY